MALKLLVSATRGLNSPQSWSTFRRSIPPVPAHKRIEPPSSDTFSCEVSTVATPLTIAVSPTSVSSALEHLQLRQSSSSSSRSQHPSDTSHQPRLPIKPTTAFGFFVKKRSQKASLAAEVWNSMSGEQRQPFFDLQECDKQRYMRDKQEFLDLDLMEQKRLLEEKKKQSLIRKKRRAIKSLKAEDKKPPAPQRCFFKFYLDRFREKSQMCTETKFRPTSEFTRQVAREWREADEDVKAVYRQQYQREKAEYEMKMLLWEKKMIELGHTELVRKDMYDVVKPKPPKRRAQQKNTEQL